MKIRMQAAAPVAAVLTLLGATQAVAAPQAVTIARHATTWSGQTLALPQGEVVVTAIRVDVPAGGRLPPHKHPFPRFAYVLEGRIRVVNEATAQVGEFGPGDFVVESLDQWHAGEALGGEPVRLLVIDQAPPGTVNVVPKAP